MLYFSETVWVFISSSLPAREGALESSNGEENGPSRLSLLPASELQLVLLDDMPEPALDRLSAGRSWYWRGFRALDGASSISEESATPGESFPYNKGPGGDRGGWLIRCGMSCLVWADVPDEDGGLSVPILCSKSPPLPELTVM